MNTSRIDLTASEQDQLLSLTKSCLRNCDNFNDEDFLKKLPLSAYKVPDRLLEFLNEFKYSPFEDGYCIVSTGLINDCEIGPTPSSWELTTNNQTCQEAIMAMCLCATVLGDIYGWLTQQDGRVIHDILPMKQHEGEQLGCGSREELTWHTEDAFHELRGDYLIMMCLRNNEQIPTTLSKPDYSHLSAREIDILFEERFVIKPDNSHKMVNNSSSRDELLKQGKLNLVEEAYGQIDKRNSSPEKIAVLFGNKKDPCLRLDPYFMETPDDDETKAALDKLIDTVTDSLVDVSLNPGEIIVIDNFEVVHGRRPFKAKYDGSDRWYKRINVIRDIRRCNSVLENKSSRIVY